MSEYTAGGSSIGLIVANANDVGDFVTYKIIAGNTDNAFVVDALSGALSISSAKSRLDYEEQSQYDLTVQVTDTYGASTVATVSVEVNDVEFISHSFSADLSATESTFGSTAFTDILHVATMNEIAGGEVSTADIDPIQAPGIEYPPGFDVANPENWQKKIEDTTKNVQGLFEMNLGVHLFFEPRLSMQTGQVVSDIPVSMDLAYADEIQVGQETLITSKVNIDNYAEFTATSPAFEFDFALGVKDLSFGVKSDIILDKHGDPLNKQTALDEGSFEVTLKSDELAVVSRHCLQTLGQPACLIGSESDETQPLRMSASIDADDWFEQELYYKTSWKAWYHGASGQAISHNVEECREDFFYPAGEDLFYRYNFEMLDTFLSVYADIKQDFYLEVRPISRLTLEDGSELVFKGDEDIRFTPEQYHDVNNDGVIDANLTVNLYSVFYNDTKTSMGARLPFQMGIADWNIQEAVCTSTNVYLYQQSGAMYEKGTFGPVFDFEFGFHVEELSLTEWKWDEAAEALASPFVKKSESVEPLPPYLYNDNEWLLAHEKVSKDISFDLCNQDGECGQPVLSFHNNAPTATDVVVTGEHTAKRALAASYVYSDYEGDAESKSVHQWFIATDSAGSDEAPIVGETTLSYTPSIAEVGKYVRYCVRPNDGSSLGFVSCSSWQQIGTPFYQDGSILTGFGQAAVFDGVTQSLLQENYGMFNPDNSFTIELWLNVNELNSTTHNNVIVFKNGSLGRAALRVKDDGSLRVKVTDTTFYTTQSVSLNSWHHVAMTYDSTTGQLTTYLDGDEVISVTDSSTFGASDIVWGANKNRGNSLFNGKLDELRVWSKAKTADEVKQGMLAGVSLSDPELLSYVDFEGADTYNISERVGNVAVSAQDSLAVDKHRSFAVLDGNDDYVEIEHNTRLSFSKQNFSVQAWVYVTGDADYERSVISKISASNTERGWSLRIDNNNRPNFRYVTKPLGQLGDSKRVVFDFTSDIALNNEQWYHLAATVDRNNRIAKLYLDGAEVQFKNLDSSEVTSNTVPMRIGAFSGSGAGGYFEGLIDDVAIWKRVLTQDEIQACMQGMQPGCENDLMVKYDFENKSADNKLSYNYPGSLVNGAHTEDSFIVTFNAKNGETLYGALPVGDGVAFELMDSPNNGTIYLDEYTGEFEYIPNVDNPKPVIHLAILFMTLTMVTALNAR
ncbi:hypothetical protein EXU30_10160 [Shewanella maritima]|uniref:Cadherin domain-containing protein n=1 Tax=Shewanella maritima TaxID=2520507 RepID=A0A411PHK4_9GAMM|nr:LamG-like jellyroll fold domain-containing protein [Shewanella maritima]QBF83015.1 hypothetical protein EXU30_10160 [Shewanella maritima]